MSIEASVKQAVAETILTTGITPQTTLAQIAHAGDTSVFIPPSDTDDYASGGVLSFWDGTGEKMQAISPVTDGVSGVNPTTGEIKLNFAGRASGLAFDHAEGAAVGTNLMTDAPVVTGPMIAAGPVLFVYTARSALDIVASRKLDGPMTLKIQHNVALLQSQYSPMDPNLWAFDQQQLADENLDIIIDALVANWHLNGANGPNAQGLGEKGRGAFVKEFIRSSDEDTPQLFAVLTVTVRPHPPRTVLTS